MPAFDNSPGVEPSEQIAAVVRQYWGFDSVRPLQEKAITASLEGRDSLVVMPTGGGKSLCYQVPPLLTGGLTVVVSPLISLMKDQVDGLLLNGYPAAALNSSLLPEEQQETERRVLAGEIKLIFTSPERLSMGRMQALLQRAGVESFAIDEAHCISQWGHDFRPEYRQLANLREQLPRASIHAYTATATSRVRDDIVEQLRLRSPQILVGRFDRPNLVYRVVGRTSLLEQVGEILDRHRDQATIIYCLSRKDTEGLAEDLRGRGVVARAYHAGMTTAERRNVQEAFAGERLNTVVATIAFGMGIDRSDVRCVIHAALPKSIESYQQETGRAGRDGLEAECVLLYASSDAARLRRLMEDASDQQLGLLEQMRSFATAQVCRHRALSQYFDQAYEAKNCAACDVCLTSRDKVAGGNEVALTIIECVRLLRPSFGATHVADILAGGRTKAIRERGHDRLAVWGKLHRIERPTIVAYIDQLVGQGLLRKEMGRYPTLVLTAAAGEALRGEREVDLVAERSKIPPRAVGTPSHDTQLFEKLRSLRRDIARERDVPPFVVFSDVTLRDMARLRPRSIPELLQVKGVGERKAADFGQRFLQTIEEFKPTATPAPAPRKRSSFALFESGASIDEAVAETGLARSTIGQHLSDYVSLQKPADISAWVDAETYRRVADAGERVGWELLKPIWEDLGGTVDYERIRLVRSHVQVVAKSPAS
ncbi:MAG TPA: RecQ family ATP-dependent DNA helicase [Dehalococcoidia bacterium]|nr:RecQ family ATP-dependent DNA helicase [Dehalococcoidia bacterium]